MPGALRKQKSVPNAVHAVQLSFDDGVNRGMERPDMSELDQLVEILLAKHEPGLKLPAIRIASRMRRTLGSYAGRKRRISMSAHLLALGSDEQKREILLHELAHALEFHLGEAQLRRMARVDGYNLPSTPERRADAVAEIIWGDPIYYDRMTVQTLSPGRKPRPAHLPK